MTADRKARTAPPGWFLIRHVYVKGLTEVPWYRGRAVNTYIHVGLCTS